MVMFLRAGLAAVCLAVPAGAQTSADWTYISDEGHAYGFRQNDSGAVLTSIATVHRPEGTGAGFRFVEEIEVIYLGRSCDAASPRLGQGTWAWANGGFVVEFPTRRIAFPRQEIDAGQGLGCLME